MKLVNFKKGISILIVISFLFTNTLYAAPSSRSLFKNKRVDTEKLSTKSEERIQSKKTIFKKKNKTVLKDRKKKQRKALSLHLEDLTQIHIPSELGRIVEVYQAPESDESLTSNDKRRLIVHIQDLHTNAEAQYNEASILELLIKDYGLALVCSEGADGEVDTSSVSSFPDPEVREKTARLFVDSGELTAEEYLSITKYPDLPIWGIEDRRIYFKNIIQFNKIMRFNTNSLVFISQAQNALNALKSKIYSKELKEIDKKEIDYEDEVIETEEYLGHLASYIQKFNISTADYKNIGLLTETIKQEKTIDQAKVMQESQALLVKLQAKLSGKKNRKYMDGLIVKADFFKEQKISPFSFYSYLKNMALKHLTDKMEEYPQLDEFVDYLTKVNSLNSTKLFNEMEDLAYEVKMRLAKDDKQKNFIKALRNIKFLEGFFNLKISNEELDFYLANREAHKVNWFKSIITNLTDKTNSTNQINYIDFNPDLIDMRLEDLDEFYETVKERDTAMVRNAIQEIERRDVKVAAFVSGGFHTKGITKMFREKGYSYIVISPYSSTQIDEENYKKLLSGKRRPISELIEELNGTLRSPLIFNYDFAQWDRWVSMDVSPEDLNPDMFRDYDYRSTGQILKPSLVFRLGLVWADMALEKAKKAGIPNRKVLVARDARKIEQELVEALIAAFRYKGLDVIYIAKDRPNVVSSYSWAVQEHKPLISIFITASHVSRPKEEIVRGFKVAMLDRKNGTLQSMTSKEIKEESKRRIEDLINNPEKINAPEGIGKGNIMYSNIDNNCVRICSLVGKVAGQGGSLYELARELGSNDSPIDVLTKWEA